MRGRGAAADGTGYPDRPDSGGGFAGAPGTGRRSQRPGLLLSC